MEEEPIDQVVRQCPFRGSPVNEGAAGKVACCSLFAGKPAPTGLLQAPRAALHLWERVYPRRGRRATFTVRC
ncbi:hypothetical protein EI693_18595 [Pseudomonas oryziphila]|uniref:Uncharacterized protein n=1 Tax=Pseudomonas oryziphila TaxID=2894079 RepID=A0ABM7CU32_9PSED|nr:hypothetical protein EI693_18595 [Pseudomonas oryziphila]